MSPQYDPGALVSEPKPLTELHVPTSSCERSKLILDPTNYNTRFSQNSPLFK
ncbi:unnamed protein product, partial [Nesidiocoris tenuis]